MNKHRAPQLALLLAVLVAGCSSGGSTTPPQAGNGSTPTSSASGTGTPGSGTPGPGQSGTAGGGPSGTAGGGPSGATGRPGSTSGPNGSSTGRPGGAASGIPDNGGPLAALGRYPASQTGSETFGTNNGGQQTRRFPGAITVEVRAGQNADEREVFVPYSSDRDDTIRLSFADGEVKLMKVDSRLAYTDYLGNRTLLAVPPIPLYPNNPRVGQEFSGSYSGSNEGDYAGRVLRREKIAIGGRVVDAFVVDLVVNFREDYTGSSRTTTWWDPSRRLPLKQHLVSNIKDSLGTYRQDVTVTLKSLSPQ